MKYLEQRVEELERRVNYLMRQLTLAGVDVNTARPLPDRTVRLAEIGTALVTQLELSTRARGVVLETGAVTVADLVKFTRVQLLRAPRCGKMTIGEIEDELRRIGLTLATDDG